MWQLENDDEQNHEFVEHEQKDKEEKPPIQYNFDKRPVTAAIKRPVKKTPVPKVNDDIDDLDDLMGDGNSKAKNNYMEDNLDDEDDFFGGGRNEEDYSVSKKKKKGGDDPLAFLHRAQEEKENNAEKQAMMEQEAIMSFKKPEELDYNLKCQYMDQEDKWRKALGNDLYKVTNLNVNATMRQ